MKGNGGMRLQILVRLKSGVLDVQGKAVESGLHDLGFGSVSHVRIGKLIEFELEGKDPKTARQEAEAMCRQLLVNSIIEDFEIKDAP